MQIKALHRNIYRLYAYARTQKTLDQIRILYEQQVRQWEKLKSQGVDDKTCQEVIGVSRPSYYRHRKSCLTSKKAFCPRLKDQGMLINLGGGNQKLI